MSTDQAQITDVRYERYEGERRGRAASVWSLVRWGMLRSLGARRSWRAKAIPIALILGALGPAVVVLGVRALFEDETGIDLTDALPFSGYQAIIGIIILVFAAVTAPELVCPDRRDGTLALYFSTAVSRREYLLGRLAATILPLLLVTMVPMLVLYGGILVFEEHPVGYLEDHWDTLPAIVAAGAVVAVYYAVVALAASSLTPRRTYAIGGYLLVLIAPSIVGGLVGEATDSHALQEVLSVSTLPILLAGKIFPDNDVDPDASTGALLGVYLLVVVGAALVLLARYRKSDL